MHRILMLLTVASLFVLAVSGCSSDSTSTVSPPTEDLTPPAAPVNLSVSCKGDQITVAWRENSELDLSGYHVYRDHAGSGYSLMSSPDNARFIDDIDDSGLFEFSYRISAVDASGNESAYSASVDIVVDTTEPFMEEVCR